MKLDKGKINIGFVDGQWGSSGKGKFNAYLTEVQKIDFAISQNSVNASHIVEYDNFTYKFQHLPSSVVDKDVEIVIGAGASIELPQLLKEMDDWDCHGRTYIHPNAVIITPDDIEYERANLQRIASTMTGNGAAMGRKVMRHPNVKTASDCPELKSYITDTSSLIAHWLCLGRTGILETAQGFDLSIDHGMLYDMEGGGVHKAFPYTTSRNVDPLTFAGMSGIPARMIGKILLNLRTFPIKVGDGSNSKIDGYSGVDLTGSNSGPCWPDQMELDWEKDLAIAPEITSLTKRKRRVFDFSFQQLQHITKIVQPHYISLNFVNYLDPSIAGVSGKMGLDELEDRFPHVFDMVCDIEINQFWTKSIYAAKVVWLGTGPHNSEVIELVY